MIHFSTMTLYIYFFSYRQHRLFSMIFIITMINTLKRPVSESTLLPRQYSSETTVQA